MPECGDILRCPASTGSGGFDTSRVDVEQRIHVCGWGWGGGVQIGAASALPKIITTGFRAVQLIYFFTAGEDEVRCWQIRRGTKAPQVPLPLSKAPPAVSWPPTYRDIP